MKPNRIILYICLFLWINISLFAQDEHSSKATKWYNVTYISSLSGRQAWKTWSLGAAVHNVTGYQFNRFLGIGVGLGFDVYAAAAAETLIPIYTEFRGYILDKNFTPYYTLAAGYGFAIQEKDYRDASKGGYMLYPTFGFRFNKHFTADLGLKLQKASYRIGDFDIQKNETNQEKIYQRVALRLGLIF